MKTTRRIFYSTNVEFRYVGRMSLTVVRMQIPWAPGKNMEKLLRKCFLKRHASYVVLDADCELLREI